ncbi:MAG: succinylglutamate desuccinylase/aspartoacylase family protein [Spirochaetaceae bacterium]|jgi:hypothetical protein|nr:succinylglutamate desuccinylase/aspartoacylase family protein [Spirochaetaceae bacterium]
MPRPSVFAVLAVLVLASCATPKTGGRTSARLSDYLPSLAGGPGDVAVYYLESGKPGAVMFAAGGAHGNEIGGIAAASVLAETGRVNRGRIIVIPALNTGGTRLISADGSAAGSVDGPETNINRAYPGVPGRGLAGEIALAVMNLLRTEHVDIAFDLHEAAPDGLAWHIVANPKNLTAAAETILDLEDEDFMPGFLFNLEASAEANTGFSHREWGDRTGAGAFLIETANPAQAPDAPGDIDQFNHPEYPLWKRAAFHLEAMRLLVKNSRLDLDWSVLPYAELPEKLPDIQHLNDRLPL